MKKHLQCIRAVSILAGGLFALVLALPGFATVPIEDVAEVVFTPRTISINPDVPPLPVRQELIAVQPIVLPAWSSSTRPADAVRTLINRTNRALSPMEIDALAQGIQTYSDSYGVDARLLASLVAVESSFRSAAISSSGAIGLGQLKPDTARWLGVDDPFDPMQNLMGVAKYMRYLLDRYQGSVPHALAAYYQGQGTIDRQGINDNARYYISKVNRVLGAFD